MPKQLVNRCFTQITAVQVTDAFEPRRLIDIVYAIDTRGDCWRNICGKGWEPFMEILEEEK